MHTSPAVEFSSPVPLSVTSSEPVPVIGLGEIVNVASPSRSLVAAVLASFASLRIRSDLQMETLNGIAPASSCSEELMPDEDLDFGFTWPNPGHGLKFGMNADRSTYPSMSPPAGI